MNKSVQIYVGIDNGVTGTYAFIDEDKFVLAFDKHPLVKIPGYQKTKATITRTLDIVEFEKLFDQVKFDYCVHRKLNGDTPFVFNVCVERPMINPKMFKASMSAIRFDQAFHNFLNLMDSNHSDSLICRFVGYIDSKTWQKEFFPKNHTGLTKFYSQKKAIDLFPLWKMPVEKHGDGDSILIAEYLRRGNL